MCGGCIAALLALAWAFRRYVARHLARRAAQRSLRIVDVLPLGGKQKLVVVRCYDRSFLLGLGEKEVRAIAELEGPAENAAPASFANALAGELELQPVAPLPRGDGPRGDGPPGREPRELGTELRTQLGKGTLA